MIETSRYKELVFGFVFGTWNWYDFWRRSWGLPCSRPLLPTRCFCVTLMRFYIGTAQLKKVLGVGLKPDLQGGTRFNLLRVQFWTPRAKETYLKGGQKVDPLKSKVVPPGESSFGPFIVADLLKRLFQVEADLTSNSCDWNLELGRPLFARLLFLKLWGPKKGPFFVILARGLWQERLLATWLWLGKGAGLKF